MNNEYESFLKSPKWVRFSADLKHKRGNLCELCGSNDVLNVHHIVYTDDLMDEKTLIVLCRNCHECTERMIHRFRREVSKSFILKREVEEVLFKKSILDYYQNSFYAPNTKSTINAYDSGKYGEIKRFMLNQIKQRFPYIETQYNPVRTSEYLFAGDCSKTVLRWRDEAIKSAIDDGFPDYSIQKRFRMSDAVWQKAKNRIFKR